MIISFFEVTEKEEQDFKKAFPNYELKFFKEEIQDVDINKYLDSNVLSVFIYSKVDKEIIDKCKELKLICTRSTGTDHIDLEYAKNRGVQTKNVPLYGENTVAEHTFALILSLSRKINKSYHRVLSGKFTTDGLQGFDLKGKTLGIIGGGRIGLNVTRMAKSFGMHVRVFDINKDEFLSEILNFKYISLDELYATCDIISLHVPYNKHTHHIINRESISKMKDGVIIINTARGGLVDTDSLIKAINDGKVSSAGLDVLEGEEYLVEENLINSPLEEAAKLIVQSRLLLDNENVVITPHNAFNSKEALDRIIETTIDNIKQIS